MALAFWDDSSNAQLADAELTTLEKQLRDQFVKEYLYDHDAIAAALRCGFALNYAIEYSQKFLSESYVRIQLKQLLNSPESAIESDKNLIFNTLREVMHVGSYGDKVRAAAQMAALLGVGVANKQQSSQLGGVMVVPAIADNLDDWEREAVISQEATLNNVSQ